MPLGFAPQQPAFSLDDLLKNLKEKNPKYNIGTSSVSQPILSGQQSQELDPVLMAKYANILKPEQKFTPAVLEQEPTVPLSSIGTPSSIPSRSPAGITNPPSIGEAPQPSQFADLIARLKQQDTSTQDLEKAQGERRQSTALANILSGLEQAGRGYAGGASTVIAPQAESMGAPIAKMGEQSLQDVIERSKSKKEALATDIGKVSAITTLDGLDPNSEISKSYQLLAKSKFGKFDTTFPWDKMSAKEIGDLFTQIKQFGKEETELDKFLKMKRAEYFGARTEGSLHGIVEKDEKTRERYQNQLEKHPVWKAAKEFQSAGPSLKVLLEDAYKNGGQSLAALGARLAKYMGEKGVMTDEDVIRYVKPPTWLGGFASDWKKGTVGKITNSQYTDIKRMMDRMDVSFDSMIKEAEDETIKDFSKSRINAENYDWRKREMGYNQAADVLSMQGEKDQQPVKAPYGDTVEKNGKKYKWNSTTNIYQLIE